jgi:hypothetical protein
MGDKVILGRFVYDRLEHLLPNSKFLKGCCILRTVVQY